MISQIWEATTAK